MKEIDEKEVQELLKSPIFNVSLSSKELFHSNFLYWLAIEYPKEVGCFFAKKCNLHEEVICVNPRREAKNIDLSFEDEGGNFYYIENKVKSSPNLSQLELYSQKFTRSKKNHFILLSITKPHFNLPEGWRYISYVDYKKLLQNMRSENEYHNSLILDYLLLIDMLLQINKVSNVTDDDLFDFHSNKLLDQMRVIRIHDLYLKKTCENLCIQLYELSKKEFPDLKITNNWEPDMDLYFESGMTRSQGLLGFKLTIKGKCLNL